MKIIYQTETLGYVKHSIDLIAYRKTQEVIGVSCGSANIVIGTLPDFMQNALKMATDKFQGQHSRFSILVVLPEDTPISLIYQGE